MEGIGEVIARVMKSYGSELTVSLSGSEPSRKRKAAEERAACQECKGLQECQYAEMGNRGFRPVWGEWDERYSNVVECRYKVERNARLRTERLFGSSGIPERYRNLRIGDLPPSKAVEGLLDLILGKERSLLISGGAERSAHASAAGNAFIGRGQPVLYLTITELLTNLRYNNPEYYMKLKEATIAPILIIENLGSERSGEYAEEQLELILGSRERKENRLLITSAMKESTLIQRYKKEQLREKLRNMKEVEV